MGFTQDKEEVVNRYNKIVKGIIRKNLRKFIKNSDLIGRKGKDMVTIPIPEIELPRFRYGRPDSDGEGEGKGEGEGDGEQRAGDQPGEHIIEEITLEELAEILGEELELPRIEPKEHRTSQTTKPKFMGERRIGPASLHRFKKTWKRALKRTLSEGDYDPEKLIIPIPISDDRRYLSWRDIPEPEDNAVIFYIRDYSGSMGDEQTELVRLISFWLDTWLQKHYELQRRFILHDASAKEVGEKEYYETKSSGGTLISSAFNLVSNIISREYPAKAWNIYIFHFSDGDNWSGSDTEHCLNILDEKLLPIVNLYGYGQIISDYGTGQFLLDLEKRFGEYENVAYCPVADRDGIVTAVETFLSTGK